MLRVQEITFDFTNGACTVLGFNCTPFSWFQIVFFILDYMEMNGGEGRGTTATVCWKAI